MIRVEDTETGRTGTLVRGTGYVIGSSYVNPGWEIDWDDTEDDDDEDE